MTRGLDFSELKRYAEELKKAADKDSFRDFLKRFLIENAEMVVALAKNRTPVDTGALRATWGIGDAKYQEVASLGLTQEQWNGTEVDYRNASLDIVDADGDNMKILIWNGMEYASHIEYGTPSRPDWKWANGAHMLTVAIDEVYALMPQRFQERFAAWAAERGL